MDRNEFVSVLGKNVRRIRLQRKLTVEALALETGLAYSQISRLELGKRNPTAYTLYLISKALDVSTADLLPVDPVARQDKLTIS